MIVSMFLIGMGVRARLLADVRRHFERTDFRHPVAIIFDTCSVGFPLVLCIIFSMHTFANSYPIHKCLEKLSDSQWFLLFTHIS